MRGLYKSNVVCENQRCQTEHLTDVPLHSSMHVGAALDVSSVVRASPRSLFISPVRTSVHVDLDIASVGVVRALVLFSPLLP